MEATLSLKANQPEPKTGWVLFTKGTLPCKSLVVYLRRAWKDAGLKGQPDFTDLRTGVAKYVSLLSSRC